MKDFITGTVIFLALAILFSTGSLPGEIFPAPGTGPGGEQYPGDSGMVIPGDGSVPAEVIARPEKENPREPEPTAATGEAEQEPTAAAAGEAETETQPTTEQEESETMNDNLLLIWNGVAAVLIGETMAIILATVVLKLATAWMKNKEASNGKG